MKTSSHKNRKPVILFPYADVEQYYLLPGFGFFSHARRYTSHHLSLFSLANHYEAFLQLYLSSGILSKLVKRHLCEFLGTTRRTTPLLKLADRSATCKGILVISGSHTERTISLLFAGTVWKFTLPLSCTARVSSCHF